MKKKYYVLIIAVTISVIIPIYNWGYVLTTAEKIVDDVVTLINFRGELIIDEKEEFAYGVSVYECRTQIHKYYASNNPSQMLEDIIAMGDKLKEIGFSSSPKGPTDYYRDPTNYDAAINKIQEVKSNSREFNGVNTSFFKDTPAGLVSVNIGTRTDQLGRDTENIARKIQFDENDDYVYGLTILYMSRKDAFCQATRNRERL